MCDSLLFHCNYVSDLAVLLQGNGIYRAGIASRGKMGHVTYLVLQTGRYYPYAVTWALLRDTFSRFGRTRLMTNRQTDGQIQGRSIYRSSIMLRGKNDFTVDAMTSHISCRCKVPELLEGVGQIRYDGDDGDNAVELMPQKKQLHDRSVDRSSALG